MPAHSAHGMPNTAEFASHWLSHAGPGQRYYSPESCSPRPLQSQRRRRARLTRKIQRERLLPCGAIPRVLRNRAQSRRRGHCDRRRHLRSHRSGNSHCQGRAHYSDRVRSRGEHDHLYTCRPGRRLIGRTIREGLFGPSIGSQPERAHQILSLRQYAKGPARGLLRIGGGNGLCPTPLCPQFPCIRENNREFWRICADPSTIFWREQVLKRSDRCSLRNREANREVAGNHLRATGKTGADATGNDSVSGMDSRVLAAAPSDRRLAYLV